MTAWDKQYMRTTGRKPKPIKESEYKDVFWYYLGSALGFVFWIYFIVWFVGH